MSHFTFIAYSFGSGSERTTRSEDTFNIPQPFNDRWSARLPDILTLAETRAIASAMRGVSNEKLEEARSDAVAKREMLEFTQWVRVGAGLNPPAPVKIPLAERNELANLQRFIYQRLVREPQWTRLELEVIRDFSQRAPEKDHERLSAALDEAEHRLEHIEEKKRKEQLKEAQRKVDRLHESLDRCDASFTVENFPVINLEDAEQRDHLIRQLTESYDQIIQKQGFTPERAGFLQGELAKRARGTVSEVIELAERIRETVLIAILDDPPLRVLDERLNQVGITLHIRQARSREVERVDLGYRDLMINSRHLSQWLDGRVLADRADDATQQKYSASTKQIIRKCMEMALATDKERERIMSQINNRSGTHNKAADIFITRYASLVVNEIRSGAERTWKGIDQRILEAARPSDIEDRKHLIQVYGVAENIRLDRGAVARYEQREQEKRQQRNMSRSRFEPANEREQRQQRRTYTRGR